MGFKGTGFKGGRSSFRSTGHRGGSSYRGSNFRGGGSAIKSVLVGSAVFSAVKNLKVFRWIVPVVLIIIAVFLFIGGSLLNVFGTDNNIKITEEIKCSSFSLSSPYKARITGMIEEINDEKAINYLLITISANDGYEGEITHRGIIFDSEGLYELDFTEIVDNHRYTHVENVKVFYLDGSSEMLTNPEIPTGSVSRGLIIAAVIMLIVSIGVIIKIKKTPVPAVASEPATTSAFDVESNIAATRDSSDTHEVFDMTEFNPQNVRQRANSGQWKCEYCGGVNNSSDNKCTQCGAGKYQN